MFASNNQEWISRHLQESWHISGYFWHHVTLHLQNCLQDHACIHLISNKKHHQPVSFAVKITHSYHLFFSHELLGIASPNGTLLSDEVPKFQKSIPHKSILLSIHTMSTSPLRQAACNGVVFVGGMAWVVVWRPKDASLDTGRMFDNPTVTGIYGYP